MNDLRVTNDKEVMCLGVKVLLHMLQKVGDIIFQVDIL